MNNTPPDNPDDKAFRLSVGDPRSCQATIVKVADGYTVTVSLKRTDVHARCRRSPSTPTPMLRMWRRRLPHSASFPGTSRGGLEVAQRLPSHQGTTRGHLDWSSCVPWLAPRLELERTVTCPSSL